MQSKFTKIICITITIILGIIFLINIISQNSHSYVSSPDELRTYEYKDCDAVITKHNGSYILHPIIKNNTGWNALLDESQLGFELQENEWAKLHADFESLDGGIEGHCGEINFDKIYSHDNITLAELINQELIPEYVRSEYMQYGYYQDGRDFLSVNPTSIISYYNDYVLYKYGKSISLFDKNRKFIDTYDNLDDVDKRIDFHGKIIRDSNR